MTEKKRELIFSVTAKDCEWSFTRGTGKGGQKKNKTSSAVHCMHRPSGARGYSEASRSQADNKREAFLKMANTKEFKNWHKLETAKRLGTLSDINAEVDRQMAKVKVEFKQNGKWIDEREVNNV